MKSTVMEKIIKLNTIKEYNDFLGIETPHPLVSVIDASKNQIVAPCLQKHWLLCHLSEGHQVRRCDKVWP